MEFMGDKQVVDAEPPKGLVTYVGFDIEVMFCLAGCSSSILPMFLYLIAALFSVADVVLRI